MLHGKTIGLVGYGKVARALESRLSPFGCKTLVHSRRVGLSSPGAAFVELNALLQTSDVVCLLGALNDATRHTLGSKELALMKPSAFLINTARGGLVDEQALCHVMRAGLIAGAALDTFEVEPLPADSPLRAMPNALLTPHCIGHTKELAASLLPAMLLNIESAREGRLPPYCMNLGPTDRWRRTSPQSASIRRI